MVKIICITSFLVSLLGAALNYTIQYFDLTDKVENEKTEIANEI